MFVLTDNLLNWKSIHTLTGLRSEILTSYWKYKSLIWSTSKGGKSKLPSRKMGLDEYPYTAEVVNYLIYQKLLEQYFKALRNFCTVRPDEQGSGGSCSDFSIELGLDLVKKYIPELFDSTRLLGLKGTPVNLDSPKMSALLREAALDIETRLGVIPVIPSVHFSVMKPQSFIPIHADDKSKLLSIMLYLPAPDQNNSVNLGTSFWYPKKPHNQIYDKEEYEGRPDNQIQHAIRKDFIEHRSPFTAGSIVSFLKTPTSWHSFSYEGPDIGPRVSLNLNIHSFR